MPRKPKITGKHRTVASALRRGVTDREALLEAGYSEASANKGITRMQRVVPALEEAILEELLKQARELFSKQDHSLS